MTEVLPVVDVGPVARRVDGALRARMLDGTCRG